MKEVTINAYCDGDVHGDARVPAVVERTPGLDGEQAVVDLCESCDKALDMVRVLIAKGEPVRSISPSRGRIGRPPGKTVENPESVEARTCPVPNCTDVRGQKGRQYVAPTRSALGAHLMSRHGTRLADYTWT